MEYYKSIKLLEWVLIEWNNHTNLININFWKYFELDFDSNLEINLKKWFSKYLSSKYQDFNKSILDKSYYKIEKKDENILNKRIFHFIWNIKEEKIKELLQEYNNSLDKKEKIKDLSSIKIEKFRKNFSFENFFADFGILFINNWEEKTYKEINNILKKNKIWTMWELNTIEKLINNWWKDLKVVEKFEVEIVFYKSRKDYEITEKIHDITSLFFFEKSYYTVYDIKNNNG